MLITTTNILRGIDIRDIDMVAVRKNLIGFAEQEPILINDSILYNLNFNYEEDDGDSIDGKSSNSAPSLSQAQRMRELDQKGALNPDMIDGILMEEKRR